MGGRRWEMKHSTFGSGKELKRNEYQCTSCVSFIVIKSNRHIRMTEQIWFHLYDFFLFSFIPRGNYNQPTHKS